MSDDEIVKILQEYFESLFPKVCPCCKRYFASLREYIQLTKRIGPPISYDADLGEWKTRQPIGSVALANCPCGTTLALTTAGMPLPLRLELLDWMRIVTLQRGISASELLEHFRDEVRKKVLAE